MMASQQFHGGPPNHNRRSSEDWTPDMRDSQARGKDPDREEETASVHSGTSTNSEILKIGGRHYEETHWEKERKGEAMSVLDNPEVLLAQAQANGDSVTGQRVRFQRMLCGYDDERDRFPVHQMKISKGQQQYGGHPHQGGR
ncbi:hypothetical protein BHE90_008097 [Fusarium euwallaceae]|uniref:Uncharacterized protein n=2 Tax=Fusarium solani species complex TaxID=232080 RepID=A0A3M2RY81_9HYPO|nr:hypothetical protein CDV36_010126 [Fusarium kuroshium]RTE77417.1 hypothetical protein BHE90_008097 [Fusarium euwallaceae]